MNSNRLLCIDLDQPSLEGFRTFISAWICRRGDCTFLVDPGPLSTIPHLLAELRRHGIDQVDYILLTHIHIDHAGGAGALLREFPHARVVCHPEGIRHLVAPEKLWQGSLKVLGKLAEVYGEIVPVPEEKIGFAEEIGSTGVRVFQTPGHAQHHLCYLAGDLLFGGEVAGVRSEVPGGIFMRPATPPKFIPAVAVASIDRMIALAPRTLVFAHYGLVDNALQHLRIARRQIALWMRGVAQAFSATEPEEEVLFEWLVRNDEHFANFSKLSPDIQARERYFLGNTLRGMIEYVETLPQEERKGLSAN